MSRFLQLSQHDKKQAVHFMKTLEALLAPFSGSGFLLQTHVFAENSEINAVFGRDTLDEDDMCVDEDEGEHSNAEHSDEEGGSENSVVVGDVGEDVEMAVICANESVCTMKQMRCP